MYAFDGSDALESICIPSSVTRIRMGCFKSCSNLRTVLFSRTSKLRVIEPEAFAHCRLLESISIPSPVQILPAACFFCCSSLQTVTFGTGSKLRVIRRRAFSNCPSLKLTAVPASVEVIGRYHVSSIYLSTMISISCPLTFAASTAAPDDIEQRCSDGAKGHLETNSSVSHRS
jgi:hypothetical protein